MLGFTALSEAPLSTDASGRLVVRDASCPADILSTSNRDSPAFDENLKNRQWDAYTLNEFTAGILRDVSTPTEFVSNILRALLLPTDLVSLLTKDFVSAQEYTLSFQRDHQWLDEYLSTQRADGLEAQEILSSPMTNSGIPIDATVPFVADRIALNEALSTRIRDAVSVFEGLSSPQTDTAVSVEYLVSRIIQSAFAAELLSLTRADAAAFDEINGAAGAFLDSKLLLEYSSLKTSSATMFSEVTHAILTDQTLGQEWRHSVLISRDQTLSIEWGMARRSDAKAPVEWRSKSSTKPERIFHPGKHARVFLATAPIKKLN